MDKQSSLFSNWDEIFSKLLELRGNTLREYEAVLKNIAQSSSVNAGE